MTGKSGGGSGTTSIASGERLQKMPITATHEGDVDMTKNTVTEMTRETAVAGEGTLSEGPTKYDNYFLTKQDHSLTHQKDKSQRQGQDEDMQTLVRSTATPSQPAHPLAPDSRMLARNREIVELRLELMKHLAVAHEDGGRNLQEATRVMSLLSNLESRALSESKVLLLLICSCQSVRQDNKKTVTTLTWLKTERPVLASCLTLSYIGHKPFGI